MHLIKQSMPKIPVFVFINKFIAHVHAPNQIHCTSRIYAQPIKTLESSLYGEFPILLHGYLYVL